MKLYREIDLDKWHMYVLTYVKSNSNRYSYSQHIVRPSTTTYEEYVDVSKNRVVTFEAAVLAFDHDVTLSEILLECSLHGIALDFIDIQADSVDVKSTSWLGENLKTVQTIDCHKEDVTQLIDEIEAPRFYVVRSKNEEEEILKHLVVDRFNQDRSIKFLNGEYDNGAVIAGFKKLCDAVDFCKDCNGEYRKKKENTENE